ncbi:shikimate dehydrogenase [Eionea flava]
MNDPSIILTPNTKDTGIYAVFGNPIHHSKSPTLHRAFAEQTGHNIQYTAELVDVDQFTASANDFFNRGGHGLNVTVPFKIDALHYADQLTARAQAAGAVNTLIKKENGIIGDNTDGIGFVDDISHNLQWTLKNKRVLILGAGGAVRGILAPLLKTQPAALTIANRTVEKAEGLLATIKKVAPACERHACHYHEINTAFDIIINGTSASLQGDLPNVSSEVINKNSHCYDMMYGKEPTAFMVWANQCGAKEIADGLGMLVCQGAESFYQWRGIKPTTKSVIDQLRKTL